MRSLTILAIVLLASVANAGLQVTLCFWDDPFCELGSTVSEIDATGNTLVMADVLVNVPPGAAYENDVCWLRQLWAIERDWDCGGCDLRLATPWDHPSDTRNEFDNAAVWRTSMYYLYDDTDGSMIDVTGEHTYGWMYLRPIFYGPHCVESQVRLVPEVAVGASGIATTSGGCGGIDPSDGVDVPDEMYYSAAEYDVDQVVTLKVNITPDWDKDGREDWQDNCVYYSNYGQVNTNDDDYGNACDADFNNDGEVDINDYIIFSQKFGCEVGDPCYWDDVDIAPHDGVIDINDYFRFSELYGKSLEETGLDLCY